MSYCDKGTLIFQLLIELNQLQSSVFYFLMNGTAILHATFTVSLLSFSTKATMGEVGPASGLYFLHRNWDISDPSSHPGKPGMHGHNPYTRILVLASFLTSFPRSLITAYYTILYVALHCEVCKQKNGGINSYTNLLCLRN
jgi:hypothetical protein